MVAPRPGVPPTLLLLSLAGLLGLLAACSGGAGASEADAQARAAATRTAVRSGADCLAPQVLVALGFTTGTTGSGTPHPDAPDAAAVPDGFSPVSAVLCSTGETLTDAAGRWAAVTATRLEGDVRPLVAALDAGAAPTAGSSSATCGTGVPRSDLWLVDALGSAVRATLPGGGCGPLPRAVADGVAALDAVDVEHYPVALVDARSTAAPSP